MDTRTALRKKLLRKAGENPDLRARLLPVIKNTTPSVLTASQRAGLVDAVRLARAISSYDFVLATKPVDMTMPKEADAHKDAAPKVPVVPIEKMPGFSPMQLRQQLNRISEVRHELEIMQERLKTEMSRMKELEDEEAAGLAKLKVAAKAMDDKGKFIVDAEKAILTFTAYVQDQRPGFDQIMADPANSEFGDKAGGFFQRIAAKLGEEVSKAVEAIYTATVEDLTHTADAVKSLKVVSKTASVPAPILKKAGVVDAIVAFKDWLAGGKSTLAQRIMNFAGDIVQWVKGFVERTKLVKRETERLKDAFAGAQKALDKMLPN